MNRASPRIARDRWLAWILRLLGGLDLCSLIAVVMPHAWMKYGHALAGLGTLPEAPVVGYLARSASALYALHGLLVLYMSWDVARYAPLIRFFAAAAVVHGLIMFAIDWQQGMPGWWLWAEGPSFAFAGLLVLAIQGRDTQHRGGYG